MKCFSKAHGGVSVVGDPDQSIYGWRSAEVENLRKMKTGQYLPKRRPPTPEAEDE
jgi:DNA helicase-2/ATP-dependent DNA helicase PcrA